VCLALRVHLSETAHEALVAFPGFHTTPRGETLVKVTASSLYLPSIKSVKLNTLRLPISNILTFPGVLVYFASSCKTTEICELKTPSRVPVDLQWGHFISHNSITRGVTNQFCNILAARRYASAVFAVVVCPSVRPSVCLSVCPPVCPSVISLYCIQTTGRIELMAWRLPSTYSTLL